MPYRGEIVSFDPEQGFYGVKYEDDDEEELDKSNIKSILNSDSPRRAVDFSSLPPFPQSSARPPGKSSWVVSTIPSGDIPLRENTIPLRDIPSRDIP